MAPQRNPLFGRIFAGSPVKGLSAEQNATLRNQAILNAGLAILAQPEGVSFGRALAVGVLAGRQATAASAGALLDEQQVQTRIQRRAAILGESNLNDVERFEELRRLASKEGDLEQVRVLNDVLKDMREAKAADRGELVNVQTENGTVTLERMPDGSLRDPFQDPSLKPKERFENQTVDRVRDDGKVERFEITASGKERSLGIVDVPAPATVQGPQNELAIAGAFRADPIVAESRGIAQATARVYAAAEDPSPAGDLALIFNFMKVLDPTSAVRETEFANVQNAAGVPERIRAQFNRVLEGERLTEKTRADFVNRTGRLANAQEKQVLPIIARHRDRAARFNVDPSFAANPFEGIEAPSGETPQAGADAEQQAANLLPEPNAIGRIAAGDFEGLQDPEGRSELLDDLVNVTLETFGIATGAGAGASVARKSIRAVAGRLTAAERGALRTAKLTRSQREALRDAAQKGNNDTLLSLLKRFLPSAIVGGGIMEFLR